MDWGGWPFYGGGGVKSIANYEQLHIIGIWDALLSYRRLKQLLNHIVTTICKTRPEVIYTVDSKGFSLKLAQTLRAEMKEQGWSAPIIHMVAPTIWAYGAGRKNVFAEAFDEMLCLFPQEAPLWDDTNLKTHLLVTPLPIRQQFLRVIKMIFASFFYCLVHGKAKLRPVFLPSLML